MSKEALRWAAVVFAAIALVAGGLQMWAFLATDGPQHLIVGVFAISVGGSVLVAVIRGPGRGGDPWR